MKIGLFTLLLPLAGPAVDAHKSVPAESAVVDTQVPPLRIDRPDWRPMTTQQIIAVFAGRALLIDEDYRPYPEVRVSIFFRGGCPPREKFAADGVWARYECRRAFTSYSGRWETEKFRGGERLCVSAPDFSKLCRFVWGGAASDRVFMAADPISPGESMDDLRTFNPYRLVIDK